MEFIKRDTKKHNRNGDLSIVSATTIISNGSTGGSGGNYLPAIDNGDGTYTVDLSQVTFNGNLISTGEVSAYGAGASSGTGGVTVYDGLDSEDSEVALSANQGRILKSLIDNIDVGDIDLSGYYNKTEIDNTLKKYSKTDHTHTIYADKEHSHSQYVDTTSVQTIKGTKTFEDSILIKNGSSILDSNEWGVLGVNPTGWNGLPTDGNSIGLGTGAVPVYIRTSGNIYHYIKDDKQSYTVLDSKNCWTYCTPISHNTDTTKHITATERTNWNSVYNDWNKVFTINSDGDLKIKVNVIGEKEISAFGAGTSTGGSSGVDIVDALTSTRTDAALSANQGKILKGLIDNFDFSGYYNKSELDALIAKKAPLSHTHSEYVPISNTAATFVTSNQTGVLNFKSTNTTSTGIRIYTNDTNRGGLWWSNDSGTYLYNANNGDSIGINDSGTPFYNNGATQYTLYHSGNCIPTDANRLVSLYGKAENNDMLDRPTTANVTFTDKSLRYYLATSAMTEGKPSSDSMIIHCGWDNTGWNAQLAIPSGNNKSMQWRNQGDGSTNTSATVWNSWKTILDTYNYSSYALPKSGGTMNTDARLVMQSNVTSGNYIGSSAWQIMAFSSAFQIKPAAYGTTNFSGGLSMNTNTISFNNNELLHTKNYSSYSLPISGGSLTGKLSTQTNAYYANDTWGINLCNSDIVGVNNIYFDDLAQNNGEGIQFARTNGNWDVLRAEDGVLKFATNKVLGGTTTDAYNILTSNGGKIDGALTVQSIVLQEINEINSINNYKLHLNYRVANDVSLCVGGGNVGVGYSTPSEKVDILNNKASTNTFVHTKRGDTGYGISFGVGAGGVNRGLYDDNLDRWIIYADSSGVNLSKNIWITQDAWANGLNLNRSVAGGGCAIAVWSAGTHIGNFGINGSKQFEFNNVTNGVAVTKFYVDGNGNVNASGEVTAHSDKRLKSNIKPLTVRGELNPVTYTKDGKQCIGFIADEVQELYSELVVVDNNSDEKYLSLNYAQLTAVLYAEIKELKERITKLENK